MKTKEIAPSTDAKKTKRYYLSRIALYAGLLLLLLIPTYIAIATYLVQKNAPDNVGESAYTSLLMVGPAGKAVNASQEENAELFAMFGDLLANGTEAAEIPEGYRAGRYSVTMRSEASSAVYFFYFSPDSLTCYYTDPAGRNFQVTGEAPESFLNGSYASELYGGAITPVLTTAATDEVTPTSLSWHYRTQKGTFTELIGSDVAEDVLVYPIANDVAFYFSVEPSYHEVIIYRDNLEIYRGAADGISLSLEEDEFLDVEINAIYNQDSRLDYYGTLVYRFRMQVVEAAQFALNRTATTAGGYFLLRCENVKNTNKLVVSCEPALPAAPIIFEQGDLVYATIPAGYAAVRTLHVSYGTIAATFTLTVTEDDATHHAPAAADLGDWERLLGRIPSIIGENGAAQADVSLVPRSFRASAGTRLFAFGDTVTVAGTSIDGAVLPFDLYRFDGLGEVRSLATGRVLKVDTDAALGRYVIVDHGYGFYTWYCGLSEARCAAGDIVGEHDVVGLASTFLYHEQSALVMVTLGKAALSVDVLLATPWPL